MSGSAAARLNAVACAPPSGSRSRTRYSGISSGVGWNNTLRVDRRLDGVSDINLVNRRVDAGALLLYVGEEFGQPLPHLFQRREHETRAEAPGDLGHARRAPAGGSLIDTFERMLHPIGCKADRMRKFTVEEQ